MKLRYLLAIALTAALSAGCSESLPEEIKVENGAAIKVVIPHEATLYDPDNKAAQVYLEQPKLVTSKWFLVNAEIKHSGLKNPGTWQPSVAKLGNAHPDVGKDCICFRLLGTAKNNLGVEGQITSAALECHGESEIRRAVSEGHMNDCSLITSQPLKIDSTGRPIYD